MVILAATIIRKEEGKKKLLVTFHLGSIHHPSSSFSYGTEEMNVQHGECVRGKGEGCRPGQGYD